MRKLHNFLIPVSAFFRCACYSNSGNYLKKALKALQTSPVAVLNSWLETLQSLDGATLVYCKSRSITRLPIANLIILFTGLLLFTACEPGPSLSETERAFRQSDILKASLTQFEQSRQNSRSGLYEAYAQIDTIIEAYDLENARALTGKFEQVWNEHVIDRVVMLKYRLDKVKDHSSAYFDMLEQIASSMEDEQLRQQEWAKNQAMKQEWARSLERAEQSMSDIDAVLKGGDDLFKLMLLNSLRASITKQIDELKAITIEADSLVKSLERLSEEGMELVAGHP